VHLPDNVEFESAAFVTVGAVALHGSAKRVLGSARTFWSSAWDLLVDTAQNLKAAGCVYLGSIWTALAWISLTS